MRILVIVALALLGAIPGASAGTAEDLMRDCQGRNGDPGRLYCIGYVNGFFDGDSMARGMYEKGYKDALFCLPKTGISAEQAIALFLKYMQDHPGQWHESARSTLLVAHKNAFPCK